MKYKTLHNLIFSKKSTLCYGVASLAVLSACAHSNHVHANPEKRSPSLIRHQFQPGEITKLCQSHLEQAQKRMDALVASPTKKEGGALGQFDRDITDLADAVTPLEFMAYVSPSSELGKEASECEEKKNQFLISTFSRKDLYLKLQASRSSSPQEARLQSEIIKSFEENGLKLTDEKLEQVKTIKKKLVELETQFALNLNQDKTVIKFSEKELVGLPEDYLGGLKKSEDGYYLVPATTPDAVRIGENATLPETRKKMHIAYNNRQAAENAPLLEEAIQLRKQIASLMGFSNWMDYRTQRRMAKNSTQVHQFLQNLKNKLAERNKRDLAKLLDYKKKDFSTAAHLDPWDISYYSNQVQKAEFNLDKEKIREFFPAEHVLAGMFSVYSKLFGIKFVESQNPNAWSSDVKLYEIHDAQSGALVSYFYGDFIPRENKFQHFAAFTLRHGRQITDTDGKSIYSIPISAIVGNFSRPVDGKPSLLDHDEVETLFHEFGHIIHQTLTRAPYGELSGSSVAQDFVEAPSQMLENWVYSPDVLRLISGHYKNLDQKLPDTLIHQLIAARDFNQGYAYTRQLLFALFDYTLHTSTEKRDPNQTYLELHRTLIGIEPATETHFPASFGHLMGGYDAGYYGYLWSEVYAQDMFSEFEKKGILSPEMGARYRSWILEPGNMEEASELLKKFLGREPSTSAFFERLGIGK